MTISLVMRRSSVRFRQAAPHRRVRIFPGSPPPHPVGSWRAEPRTGRGDLRHQDRHRHWARSEDSANLVGAQIALSRVEGGCTVSLIRMRDALLRPPVLRKTMLLLVLVAALVAGLLAMHIVASAMGGHNDAPASTMAMQGAVHHADAIAVPGDESTAVSDCADSCDPGHSMVTMVCVLALLITVLALGALRRPALSGLLRAILLPLRRIVAFAAAAFPLPPSLNALSISRT